MRDPSLSVAVTVIILFSVAACTTFSEPKPPPQPAPQALAKPICLPMVSYSKAEQGKAADELQALKPGSVVGRMVVDYGTLRAANRAVCGAQ